MTPLYTSGRHGRRRLPGTTRRPITAIGIAIFLALSWLVPAAAQDTTATPDETPVPTPAADAPRIELEFTELNDSGVTGTATLFEEGEQTIVELDMEGTGENHPAHIHEGSCDDIEPQPAYNLANVGEDGVSRSLVDAPLQDLIDGDYVIDLHRAPNELGTLIVCADIEGTPEVPGTGGEGTAEATEVPTEEPSPTPEPTGTGGEVATETPTPTPEPTEEPTPTPSPTEEPTPTPEPTGTGGEVETPTPAVTPAGDGTDGGKGSPLNQGGSGKGNPISVGGASSRGGDGTTGSVDTSSGKGEPVGGTSGLPETTGTGSSLIFPGDSSMVLPMATAGVAILLFGAGLVTRRGSRRA